MQLFGPHFVADVRVPENASSNLILPSTDWRNRDDKPDVYVGKVEQVGDGCQWVKEGNKVAFLRWDYTSQSIDVGEGKLLVHEKDVMILGETETAPGIVAINVLEKDSGIQIPDWVKMNNEASTLIGQVIASGWQCTEDCMEYGCRKEHVAVNDIVVFRRIPEVQYRLGSNTIIFDNRCRHCRDHAKMDCPADIILAKFEEVVVPKMLLGVA